MNILITSYYYYPELTPRAFRTFELGREFCRQGHKVKLILPNKDCYEQLKQKYKNLTIVYVGKQIKTLNNTQQSFANDIKLPDNNISKKTVYNYIKNKIPQPIKEKIKKYREWKQDYFFPIRNKSFIKALYRELKQEKQPYDLIISIAWPIETHIATAYAKITNKHLRETPVTVAEYGDPFSKQEPKIFCAYFFVDFFIARVFKYLSVPSALAIPSYTSFKSRKRIEVIPQGFNLTEYKIGKYMPNAVPSFAYAGCFYAKLRNPEVFFHYLNELQIDYRFVIFTIKESRDTKHILNKYKDTFGEKLIVIYNTERHELITKLSMMDFLINFENTSNNQIPSKLIDYAIAKRPICPLSTVDFQPGIFEEFLKGEYANGISVDLDYYDIRRIANEFLKLK